MVTQDDIDAFKAQEDQPAERKITVAVLERDSPFPPAYPFPLLYTIVVPHDWTFDKCDDSAILRQIAEIRYDELGCIGDHDRASSILIDEIMNGLELLFAFEGDIPTVGDWR